MTISVTTGAGFAGSIYTSTVAGQWRADGVDIAGETGTTYTMTLANEGKSITCNGSNSIELWVPSDAGAVAVMDIRQGVALTVAAVNSWTSQVGSVVASQGTAFNKPAYDAASFNGNAGITFDANDDRLSGMALSVNPTSRSWVGLANFGNNGSHRNLINSSGSGGYALRKSTNSKLEVVSTAVSVRSTGTVNVPASSPGVISSRFTSSGPYSARRNGASIGAGTSSGGFSGTGTESIGTTGNGIGSVLSTHVITDSYLSDADNEKLEGWVCWSSGNQNLLPVGHPYASAPPLVPANDLTLAATETGSDTAALVGTVSMSATLGATENGSDTAALVGAVQVSATLGATETGSDTAALLMTTLAAAQLAATETGADSASVAVEIRVAAQLAAAESGTDTASIAADLGVTVAIAAVEVGSDLAAIIVSVASPNVSPDAVIPGQVRTPVSVMAGRLTLHEVPAMLHAPIVHPGVVS